MSLVVNLDMNLDENLDESSVINLVTDFINL